MRHSNTCFGAYLYSAGTQHENRLKSVDYEKCAVFFLFFFRRLTLEFASAKTNAIEKYGEDLEKNEGEWTGEAKIRTRKKLWHRLSIFGYILTYSVLLRENIRQLWGFIRGDLNISASAVPNNKDTFKTKRNGKLQHIKLSKQ